MCYLAVMLLGMRTLLLIVVAAVALQAPAKSVWDGVYTEAQATRGKAFFDKECSRCHDQSDYSDPAFMKTWAGPAFNLFQEISVSMPMDAPGKLDAQAYVDLVAFMFKSNSFPAGDTELSPDPDALKLVKIEPKPVR